MTVVKSRLLLVKSRARKVRGCDPSRLDGGRGLKPIVIRRFVYKNRVTKTGINHSLQFFGLSIPAFRTTVHFQGGDAEIVTYHSFLNGFWYIPVQILFAFIFLTIVIDAMLLLIGVITMPIAEFLAMVGLMVFTAIGMWAFAVVFKFLAQFIARNSFKIIGDAVEAWLKGGD